MGDRVCPSENQNTVDNIELTKKKKDTKTIVATNQERGQK